MVPVPGVFRTGGTDLALSAGMNGKPFETHLDWSGYASYGIGDAYADVPANGGDFARAVAVCIGNRQCQRTGIGVMCPSFRITDDPAHSTRERIVALKAALNGQLNDEFGADAFTHARLHEALDLCVSCKGCKRECPNGVDMASLKIEALAQRNAVQGVPRRDALLARLPRHLHRWPVLATLLRWRNRVPLLARLGERLMGISARRRLPEPAGRGFEVVPELEMPDATLSGREVVLLVDTWTRYFEPRIAEAVLAVLRAGGYRVLVAEPAADDAEPARPLCCGRSHLSAGMVEEARAEARRLLAALTPHVAAGRPVIGLEPSCLIGLKDEYRKLGLGDGAAALAKQALLFEEFLAAEHAAGRLALDLKPIGGRALVHGHCHQKAFGAMKSVRKVLKLIPGLDAEMLETSCCGMAGGFGYEAEHHDVSMQMAEQALLPAVRAAAPEDVILADGFSCRHQIRDGSGREPRHVAELLYAALS
ncbi:MAG: 4Fe-4S dicluster domain-containing protein [Chromatiales bacterium]|nr:4Fe-4S dicluster domain-containing protein [Chromatiales bacterium]